MPERLTVQVPAEVVAELAEAMRLATREAVNKSAEVVTLDARRRVRAAVGADQRLSGVKTRKRAGSTRRVTPETIGKGGTRINPYYRAATSETNPQALVGVRGPAQYIEHPRRGGYEVRPLDRPVTPAAIPTVADMLAATFGTAPDVAAARLRHPALATPQGPRARARPGAIATPLAPITKAFAAAPATIHEAARDAVEASMRRRFG